MNKIFVRIVVIIMLCSGFSACRLMKVMKSPVRKPHVIDSTLLKSAKKDMSIDTSAAGQKKTLMTIVEPLWSKTIDFKTFSGKAKMHYDGPELNVDFIAHIRIRKDSVIWINITGSFLGIQAQVGRVLITKDSVKFVNQLQKEVTLMAMGQATSLLNVPVDYSLLQNFIMGDAFRKSGNITDVTSLPEAWAIQVEDDSSIQRVTYSKTDSTIANVQMAMRNNNSLHGINQFKNYFSLPAHKFATGREANIQYAGKQYYLGVDFQNFDFDVELDYPFSIPKNFSLVGR